ncbi:MAG: hypothetical protein SV375_06365 [Thermodesulfobacteriota bacterium]|nr:hypothetical protein [Thermodesulfobacteriota bacterium]
MLAGEILLRLFARDIVPFSVPHYDLGHVYRKNFKTTRFNKESQKAVCIFTNKYGFVDKEWGVDQESFRIMIIGDSFVEAFQVNRDERFTNILESKYSEIRKKAKVFNLGKGGCGPENYLEYLKKFYPVLKPDVVIVCIYNGNDFDDANYRVKPKSGRMNYIVLDNKVIKYRDIASLKERVIWNLKIFLGKFYMIQIMHKWYLQIRHHDKKSISENNENVNELMECPICCSMHNRNRMESFRIFEFILNQMKAIAGKKLIILQIPFINQRDATRFRGCDALLPENFMKKICGHYGVKLIQLLPLMGNNIRQYYWSHFNYYGHIFVADVIYDFLLPFIGQGFRDPGFTPQI